MIDRVRHPNTPPRDRDLGPAHGRMTPPLIVAMQHRDIDSALSAAAARARRHAAEAATSSGADRRGSGGTGYHKKHVGVR